MRNAVDKETAEAEFGRFIELNDIDTGSADTSAEDARDTKSVCDSVIRAIERGMVTIDEVGLPTIHTRGGAEIKFNEPTGMMYTAMDTRKKGHDYAKMFASLASITGQSVATFNKLSAKEVNVALALWGLFLAQ